jgi:hypothetical protein
MRAAVLDRVLEDFAPADPGFQTTEEYLVGKRDLDVVTFYVAWNPGQLEGIVRRSTRSGGAYVAYLGTVDERLRCLLSVSFAGLADIVVRAVGPSWRIHSWGITSRIASDIGLTDVRPVVFKGHESQFKLVTFLPPDEVPKVRESLFSAGAGRYGLYSKCSFYGMGKGTFFGDRGSKPAYGKSGRLEEIEESRLEVIVPADRLGVAVSSLKKVHPYEEPVIEAYEIGSLKEIGLGRIGALTRAALPAEVSRKIVSMLGSKPAYASGEDRVREVMIWDGEPGLGLYEAFLRKVELFVGPDSNGLARVSSGAIGCNVIEFPRYRFLMAGAKELVYMVREKSKREAWGLRTFLPSKA